MGCHTSKTPVSVKPIESSILPPEVLVDLRALGLNSSEMLKIHNYYHSLNLSRGETMDVYKFVCDNMNLTPNELTTHVFSWRDVLAERHKHVTFVEVKASSYH